MGEPADVDPDHLGLRGQVVHAPQVVAGNQETADLDPRLQRRITRVRVESRQASLESFEGI